jgi:RNA polymerase-interacting CarD/CdnL/TRCF family regulator
MIFLIQFDRTARRIVTLDRFEDSRREQAVERRLALELQVARTKLDHEVVLLEAIDEDQIRRTHRRYFEDEGKLQRELLAGIAAAK